MRQFQTTVQIATSPYSLICITSQIRNAVHQSGIITGLCSLFVRHTSASLVIQENADPNVLRDLEYFMKKLVREDEAWRHTEEGPDDMPSHVRSALTRTSETIPLVDGDLTLGTWQGIYLWEHRTTVHNRSIMIHIIGD